MRFCSGVATAALFTVLSVGAAQAQQTEGPGPASTGTPTDGTATVSPATVAEAASRPNSSEGLGLSLGTSIASGHFGDDVQTRIVSTALGLRYVVGGLRLSASVPYLDIRSRSLVYSGIDSTPVFVAANRSGPRVTHDGIGDLTLGASYTLPSGTTAPEIELSGRVKLDTASSDRLSTGKVDYSVGVQITKSIGNVAPFASATYRAFGDPRGINLINGFAASVGTSVILSDRVVALASYHYARAASRLVHDAHELFAGASASLPHSRLRLTGFATAGLSQGAAGVSGGLSLALDLGRGKS